MTDGFELGVRRSDGEINRYEDVVTFEVSTDSVFVEFAEESRKPPLDIAGATVGHGRVR